MIIISKLRPVGRPYGVKKTWYDYKMACVGTLIDHDMYLRVVGDTVTVYRKGVQFNLPEAIAYKEERLVGWKEFYTTVLPKILKDEKGTII